ncbi:MAG: adenosylcobinamide-GDP ribazoletransferase [Alphaproteobacteria bacterium]
MTDQESPQEPGKPAVENAAPAAPRALASQWRNDWWRELIIAAKYLTRIRVPLRGLPDQMQIGGSMAWFPLIGALIGAFGAGIDGFAIAILRLPVTVTSALAVLGMMWLTRGLHEEELASLANQYGDLGDKTRRVGWLKEERSVRYGTIAMVFVILLRVGAISSLNSIELVFATLIASSAWSHALMSIGAAWMKPLPHDPVSAHFGQPPLNRVLIALALGAAIVFAVMGSSGGLAILVSSAAAAIAIVIGNKLFGGYNGPMLGTLQQVAEIAMICALVAGQSIDVGD